MPGARSGKFGRGPERPADRGSGPDMDDPTQIDTPESRLDEIRDRPDWDDRRRDVALAGLVERFPAEALRRAVRARLGRLEGRDGEAIARLVEAYATPDLLDALALALRDQPGLAPERAFEFLGLLEAAGLLDADDNLAAWWDDLNETFDADDPLETLVAQLEEEPEGSWVALQGIGAVEPEVRAEIIAGLADFPTGPGLVAFLRLLAFAHDPTTRRAALDALLAGPDDDSYRRAWAEIGHDHPDPEVRDRALARIGPEAAAVVALALEAPGRPSPEPLGSLVTTLDGEGRGTVVLASKDRGEWIVASFACDVWGGVVEVQGRVDDNPGPASNLFDEFAIRRDRPVVEDASDLALGLLAGSLLVSGPGTNPALRYWIERTAGPDFRARAFAGPDLDPDRFEGGPARAARWSEAILDTLPDWVDRSDLTLEMAREISLRSGGAPPDPRRDAGAYRYLFEHRLQARLEHYARMLLWMASFWSASGEPDLASSALTLAWQLSDPQHAVPGHPFTLALATRSLRAAGRPGPPRSGPA